MSICFFRPDRDGRLGMEPAVVVDACEPGRLVAASRRVIPWVCIVPNFSSSLIQHMQLHHLEKNISCLTPMDRRMEYLWGKGHDG
jgi:hypothetical protein